MIEILVMTFIAVVFIGWLETDGGKQKFDKWAKDRYAELKAYWKEINTPVLCKRHASGVETRRRNLALVYDRRCHLCRKQKLD